MSIDTMTINYGATSQPSMSPSLSSSLDRNVGEMVFLAECDDFGVAGDIFDDENNENEQFWKGLSDFVIFTFLISYQYK